MNQATSGLSSPSTSSSIERLALELTPVIDDLKAICHQSPFTPQLALSATETLLRLRHTFIDSDYSREAKDSFRLRNGLQLLLVLLAKVAELYDPELPKDERKDLLVLHKDALSVLAESLKGHFGNKRYFAKKIPNGGTATLEALLTLLASKLGTNEAETQQFYGGILAAALCEETVAGLFTTLAGSFREQQEDGSPSPADVRQAVGKDMGVSETVEVTEFLGPFLRVWLAHSASVPGHKIQRLAVPACLCQLASQSERNTVALHTTGMLTSTLPLLFDNDFPEDEKSIYQELARLFCAQGLSNLDNAVALYRNAHSNPAILQFLVDVLKQSKQPPFIHFDMSLHGFCSVEFSSLGRPFPPATSAGYTLSLWARFDQFDKSTHTTLFGAFDATQTCFLLMYLEKDTRHLILQTSIQGPRPSVRFKSMVFEPSRWYHIALVHRKPKSPSSSRASLFIDGEFVEQLKIEYPNVPVPSAPNKVPRVQAFFGTPQDLAMRLGRGVSSSRWSLAGAILLDDAFSDDMVSVFYNLGPRYYGNFQDCLGSFQTYGASAALNLRNEHLHPGKEEGSDIVTAIRRKASTLIRESSILVNVSPVCVLDDDDSNNIDESQLIKFLSRHAAKNLQQLTKAGGNAIAVNGAMPAINDSLTHIHGTGVLTGDPVVAVPQSLDDASWRVGGCAAVHLSLVQAATTAHSLYLAVEALYESVQDNWRNSEAMERENGYGVLAALLREKVGCPSGGYNAASKAMAVCTNEDECSGLTYDLLRLTLRFVGYDFHQPNRSIIINPLAYRVLLVDLDIWRFGEDRLLDLYYSQFCLFATDGNFRRFNAKRLSRMRVTKKLLEALKGEDFTPYALQLFTKAFKSLMESCMTADIFRSLALFITYAMHKPKPPSKLQKKKSIRFNSNRKRSLSSADKSPEYVSSWTMAVEMLRMYCSVICNPHDIAPLTKFARAVTNKWLLYLLYEDDPEIVVPTLKILARLIVFHGGSYSKKFSEKTGGYVIMQQRLKRWWKVPTVWPICFAILLGLDVASMNIDGPFDGSTLSALLLADDNTKVVFPEMISVIAELMKSGVKQTILTEETSVSEEQGNNNNNKSIKECLSQGPKPDMSSSNPVSQRAEEVALIVAVVESLAALQANMPGFREFSIQPEYIQGLLRVLFPAVVGSDIVSPDVELNSRDGGLKLDDLNLAVRPRSAGATDVRTKTVEQSSGHRDGSGGGSKSLRRGSSFILVSSDQGVDYAPSTARIHHVFAPVQVTANDAAENPVVKGILGLVLAVFSDQLLERKDFSGLNLHLKTPPGFQEHQACFESWLLKHFFSTIQDVISTEAQLFLEPRALINLGRFSAHVIESVYNGWFSDGAYVTLDFVGTLLEYLQRPDISALKSVRLCTQAIATLRSTLFRTVLLKLSESDDEETLAFLNRLTYWQAVLLSAAESQAENLDLLCYLLYTKLVGSGEEVRRAAVSFWRIILVQKPDEMTAILRHATVPLQDRLLGDFELLVGMEDAAFLEWVGDREEDLHALFFGILARRWEVFVHEESAGAESSARNRIVKRHDKLKQWVQTEKLSEEATRKHEVTFPHWISNISASEFLKYQRVLQDQQDDSMFLWSTFSRLSMDLRRFGGVLAEEKETKWRLDQTEGRSRMRLRVVPDSSGERQDYQPKRKYSESPAIKIDTQLQTPSNDPLPLSPTAMPTNTEAGNAQDDDGEGEGENADKSAAVIEESFEMIDDPKAGLEDYEDKNRKVMRTLHRGDQVQNVCNMSRIIGLEACEGLLILGKDNVYLLDNFFQRSDGEIVNVGQAPADERDPYVRMIAGRESAERKAQDHETRSWKWSDLVSVSKRRFLFRDVALEIFFTDGSSFLLTLVSSRARDELSSQLGAKAPQVTGSIGHSRPEDVRRFETLRSREDAPQTLGSKFASVFGHAPEHPATRKWVRGEISNFHYLMLINTLAGRTFNDLTQYPVFPWVLADYTSDELDLTNPKSYRDLSKPMGCQTAERESEFRERYAAFADMGGDESPPFHYGTHYSSAMIVSSYLIRLQPFVKSYLLLQGGTFDHADRLFFSIAKAWESASRKNMSDVRELIPEFFYLPEFLVNANKYDFGLLQNKTAIDSVELPPWAKGDPKVFIAKQREALESPYVTQNLHHWIDLVFGCKQKGEAAVEAVNVFHHLSYQGAKNLDTIDDPVERLATIGIIHNFGQTPHQIFTRPHPGTEDVRHKPPPRLDVLAESLTQLPVSLLDIEERVATLSMKQDRLLCGPPLRLNIPPTYEKYMEWGFFDSSVRFYASENRKLLGHFEHLHVGQLSCALFADSRTLVTAGRDCTISTWMFTSGSKSVDLQPSGTLFGHRSPISILAVSRSFSTLLSASTDGQVMLWDLNQQSFVRELPADGVVDCARINDVTGDIAVCRGNRISLYTLNGALLLHQDVYESPDDPILSCVFYEGVSDEWLERELLFTGHRRGIVNIWSKTNRDGRFELELIRQLHHTDISRDNGSNISSGISCILPLPQVVYTGDEAGRVLKASGTVVVCDSGDFATIGKYKPQDATTNPSLILAASKKPEYASLVDAAVAAGKNEGSTLDEKVDATLDRLLVEFGKKILEIIPGKVSTEVDARFSFDTQASVNKALHIIKLYESQGISKDRILIKIASTWEGIQAAHILQNQHKINCNLTLMFSTVQAIAGAEAGAFLISPFVGRILDWFKAAHKKEYSAEEDPGVKSVQSIFNYYKKHGYNTIVMGASFRNTGEITELAGCDYLTISPNLLEDLYNSTAAVPKKLASEDSVKLDIPKKSYLNDEALFRFELNEDAMATEKLREGISKFAADAVTLKDQLKQKIQA